MCTVVFVFFFPLPILMNHFSAPPPSPFVVLPAQSPDL